MQTQTRLTLSSTSIQTRPTSNCALSAKEMGRATSYNTFLKLSSGSKLYEFSSECEHKRKNLQPARISQPHPPTSNS
jgi:hypothetical protein